MNEIKHDCDTCKHEKEGSYSPHCARCCYILINEKKPAALWEPKEPVELKDGLIQGI